MCKRYGQGEDGHVHGGDEHEHDNNHFGSVLYAMQSTMNEHWRGVSQTCLRPVLCLSM
jgi:hypothetical protein